MSVSECVPSTPQAGPGGRSEPVGASPVAGPVLLPYPPDDLEKYSYVKRRLWVLTCSSLVSFGCLAVSQFRLAQSNPWLWIYMPLLGFTVLYYLVSLRVNAVSRDFDLRQHQDLVRSWRPEQYPSVDVFLPVCGEPIHVLRNTWTHVRVMLRQYPGVTATYVLDDSASPAVAAMAAEFGFNYGSRPNRGWYKKAGNIHYGLGRSDGQYLLILDADFAPRADLFDEMLPYLEMNPRVGIVQSPQFFRVLDAQNWIERGAGAVQELFYRAVQVSRQTHDGAICVGSCAIYRRAALDSNGGTTLIEHSEDVHTGFDLRSLDWDLRYLPIVLAAGMCPDTGNAFVKQQYRWCAGSMSLLRSKKFWTTKLRMTSRLCYLSGFFYYLHTALFTFVAPLIPIILLLAMPELLKLENILLILPSIVYTTIIFPMWHRCPYRLEAWSIRMLYGWAHVFAIYDILRHQQAGWQPTGSASARQSDTRRIWIGITIWSAGTAIVWVTAAFWRMLTENPPNYSPMLASGLLYAMIVGRILIQPRTEHPAPAPTLTPAPVSAAVRQLGMLRTPRVPVLLAAGLLVFVSPPTLLLPGKDIPGGDRTVLAETAVRTGVSERAVTKAAGNAPDGDTFVAYDVRPLLRPRGKYFGAALQGAPGSMVPVQDFTGQAGKQPNLLEFYAAWGDQFDPQRIRNAWDAGALALMAWEPFKPSLADIANGASDRYIRKFAAKVRKANLPLAISFGHEMNGHWFPWGTRKSSPEDFVRAWRRIHDIFHQEGAANVIWVWSPNVINPVSNVALRPYYPGDEYVDWIGVVGYYTKFGSSSFRALYGPTFDAIRMFSAKPFILAETGAEQGVRKPADIADLFNGVASNPEVLGFVWFNNVKRADWRINSDAASLREFQRRVADQRFGFDVRIQ